MEHEPVRCRTQGAEEADVVFNMLEYIEAEKQVIMFMNVFGGPYSELDSVGALDHFDSLRRRIVANEFYSV